MSDFGTIAVLDSLSHLRLGSIIPGANFQAQAIA